MNKRLGIGIGLFLGLIAIVILVSDFSDDTLTVDSDLKPTGAKIHEVPDDLEIVAISGKIKPYVAPSGAPPSELEPEFVLVTDKDYPKLQGVIQVELYNLQFLPENTEHVQVTGYYNPKNPDWYYPEQTQRTQQVIFVEEIVELEPIDLGNEYTTQELRDRYDLIQSEFQSQKDHYLEHEISEDQYLSNLDDLIQEELKLYQDVKDHTFGRDEMTEYNFWYRGVMKFPTTIEQEVSKIKNNQ
ncbi:MAG: hypothetical protein P8X83_05205 [Nitrosopumilaceae archaeon]